MVVELINSSLFLKLSVVASAATAAAVTTTTIEFCNLYHFYSIPVSFHYFQCSLQLSYLIIVDSTDATFAASVIDDDVGVVECRCIRIGKVSNVI